MIDDVFRPGPRRWPTAVPSPPGRLRWPSARGVYVPLITPFAADGSVALDAIERLCHEYLDAGCAGIVALGTTGEAPALDADEQRAVIDVCAAACAERGAQLIVGAGTNNTAKTIAAVEALRGHAGARGGADRRAVLRAPVGSRHRRALQGGRRREPGAGRVYNIPVRTGRNLGAARRARARAHARTSPA